MLGDVRLRQASLGFADIANDRLLAASILDAMSHQANLLGMRLGHDLMSARGGHEHFGANALPACALGGRTVPFSLIIVMRSAVAYWDVRGVVTPSDTSLAL